MPVTAKLSKAFYEQFGEQVADELVSWFNHVDSSYRSDLRELNELNFARFDAKVEQRLAQFETRLNSKIERVRTDLLKWSFLFWIGAVAANVAAMRVLR